jgi:2-polyprenyl-3-methyl-5-hydroxy-6-metoxy-1,4-benzoquinol methylase
VDEDEAFWREAAPAIFNEERRKSAASEVDQVVSLASLAPGAAVLDLGCGQGRHSLEFARRGYSVTGVDRTGGYIDVARETAVREKLEIEFLHADIREFRREGRFDLAVSMLTSFGYFEEQADERRVLENARASLRPGGWLLIDLMGKEVLRLGSLRFQA